MKAFRFRKIHDINESLLHEYAGYIAGLLEGEGSFSLHYQKKRGKMSFQPKIKIGMSDEETIRWLADLLGVNYKPKVQKGYGRKLMYYTQVSTTKELKIILPELLPWLHGKRRQAELLLQFLSLKDRLPEETDVYHEMIDIFLELGQLRTKGPRFNYEAWRKRLQSKAEEMLNQ